MNSRLNILPYNPKLKQLARDLRQNMTLSEVLLWNELKNKKLCSCGFSRQRPIDEFIVDFYCKELMLAIEIDGSSHDTDEAYAKDLNRQMILENLGVRFLRFKDLDVKRNMANVLKEIENWIEQSRQETHP